MDSVLYEKSISLQDVPSFQFGEGVVFNVAITDKISAGLLKIPAGQQAGYDKGHPNADEIFYIINGIAKVHFPVSGKAEQVEKGKFILMPRGLPHLVENVGEDEVILLWACAPKG